MPKKKTAEQIPVRSLEAKDFYSDLERKDTQFAVLIRCPAATGKVKSVSIPDLPEGYCLFTSENIPGKRTFELNKNIFKIFGYGNVSYLGEPLGILVGPDEQKVRELMDQVSISFDVESLESALKNVIKSSNHPLIGLHENDSQNDLSSFVSEINNLPSLNKVIDKTLKEEVEEKNVAVRNIKTGLYKDKGEADADKLLFTEDGLVFKNTWKLTLGNPQWQETNGAFCYTEGGKIHVYTPSKWTYFLQHTLSDSLEIPLESIYVHKTKSSGFYSNGLWRTTRIAIQTALASYLCKKPVKLILSQKEQETFMAPGIKTAVKYSVALEKSGRIKALKVSIDMDVGYANPFAQEITDRLTIACCNFYKPENMLINAVAHTSKNPPTSICIKGVDSQSFFAIESQIQQITNEANLFPDEIRILNSEIKPKTDFPFLIQIDNLNENLINTIKISDFNRKYSSFKMDAIDRVEKDSAPFFALPLRGVGLASAYNVSGYYGEGIFSYNQKIQVDLLANEKLVIHTIKPSETNQEIWKKTASEILQIPKQNISIDSTFPITEIPESPEDTFSTIGIINELVKKCCTEIAKKRFHQPLPLVSKKGFSQTQKKVWNQKDFCGNPFHTTSFITTAVEVELDSYTYNEKIRGIWITIDCGELLDESAALKTVKLEVQKELTMLVSGKTVSCDNVTINFIKSKNKSGQIGELVHNSLPAAFASALSLALNTCVTEIPCTEEQLFNLIKKRGELR